MIRLANQRHRPPLVCTLKSLRCIPIAHYSSNAASDNESSNMKRGLSRLLTPEQKSLLKQAHQLNATAKSLARQVNVSVREDSLLSKIQRLNPSQSANMGNDPHDASESDKEVPPSLFTVVFAGEFNSGKSTLINALLGKELLESGVLPTTDAVTILMGADDNSNTSSNEMGTAEILTTNSAQMHLLPISSHPILSDLCLIDTPGTNALTSHTSTTSRILHDADLIIFVTSADRPFSSSEKELFSSTKGYSKRVVVVINKIDILERSGGDHGQDAKRRVLEYVTEHAANLLGERPVVIPVSGRDALSAKKMYRTHQSGRNEEGIWKRCNFEALEKYLLETLTASSKIKTKLLNPIGVAEGMLFDGQKEISQRQDDLEVDVMTLRLLNTQSAAWEKEMQAEVMDQCRSDVKAFFAERAEAVEKVLGQLSYMDQMKMGLGLGRAAFDNAWNDSMRHGRSISFGKQHLSISNTINPQSDLERGLLSILAECTESITARSKSQGETAVEYLGKRPSVLSAGGNGNIRSIGRITAPKFHRLQEDLNESCGHAIQSTASRLPDDEKWANRTYSLLSRTSLLSSVICTSAAIGPAAIGLEMLDATMGATLTASLLTLGGIALPAGNRYAAQSCRKEWMSRANELDASLDLLFQDVMRRISAQLAEAVSPYTRFVNSEGEWLAQLQTKAEGGISSVNALRSQISKACS